MERPEQHAAHDVSAARVHLVTHPGDNGHLGSQLRGVVAASPHDGHQRKAASRHRLQSRVVPRPRTLIGQRTARKRPRLVRIKQVHIRLRLGRYRLARRREILAQNESVHRIAGGPAPPVQPVENPLAETCIHGAVRKRLIVKIRQRLLKLRQLHVVGPPSTFAVTALQKRLGPGKALRRGVRTGTRLNPGIKLLPRRAVQPDQEVTEPRRRLSPKLHVRVAQSPAQNISARLAPRRHAAVPFRMIRVRQPLLAVADERRRRRAHASAHPVADVSEALRVMRRLTRGRIRPQLRPEPELQCTLSLRRQGLRRKQVPHVRRPAYRLVVKMHASRDQLVAEVRPVRPQAFYNGPVAEIGSKQLSLHNTSSL